MKDNDMILAMYYAHIEGVFIFTRHHTFLQVKFKCTTNEIFTFISSYKESTILIQVFLWLSLRSRSLLFILCF